MSFTKSGPLRSLEIFEFLRLLFDEFLEDRWSAEPCESNSVNTSSDLYPNYLWLNQYSPLAFDFKDLQSLNNLESYNPFNSSSSPGFELPSPVSDASSLTVEDRFDQKSFIDPWVIPTAFENNTNTPAAPCNSPFAENSPVISTPSLASSPGSSVSNSPWDVERDVETKKPTMRVRKHRSETSRAKSPISKQNSHNLVEKRYRNNLNGKIHALRNSIPSLCSATKGNEEGEDGMDSDDDERRKVQKCNKGIILDKAIEYIAELEKDVQRLSKENAGLKLMVKGDIPNYPMSGLQC
ncbi:uncharacterized protein PAC_18078 [Phialocephala subalpina]|uniref:BHLH domain-containing protein n=1 Tax=Phialocephala subalpina TaxID=576137 RepID=A0A1L7XT33_9HELO|nr:uncharacterized protein PAC_18078 [Phialocephala subalpina]